MALFRHPGGRASNLALPLAFATGAGAVAAGTPRGRRVVVAHGVAAMLVVLLIPWKTRIIRAGVRRHKIGRWASVALATLVVVTLLFGLLYASGVARSIGGVRGMWLHVAPGPVDDLGQRRVIGDQLTPIHPRSRAGLPAGGASGQRRG